MLLLISVLYIKQLKGNVTCASEVSLVVPANLSAVDRYARIITILFNVWGEDTAYITRYRTELNTRLRHAPTLGLLHCSKDYFDTRLRITTDNFVTDNKTLKDALFCNRFSNSVAAFYVKSKKFN